MRLRTRENFRERLSSGLDGTKVIDDDGAPVGFAMIRGSELHQFYVKSPAGS